MLNEMINEFSPCLLIAFMPSFKSILVQRTALGLSDYSAAAKPPVRKNGNHLSGKAETASIYCRMWQSRLYAIVPEMDPAHKPLSWKYPFLDQDS